jgi:hypothetical protein
MSRSSAGVRGPPKRKSVSAQELRLAAEPLVAFVNSHPEAFGGIYVDQSRGEMDTTVLITYQTPSTAIDEVERLRPRGLPVTLTAVSRTYDDLLAAQDKLTADLSGYGITMVYPDVKRNEIVAELSFEANEDSVRSAVNVPVSITRGGGLRAVTCGTKTSCTPYRGGIKITGPDHLCTWGYYVTRGGAAKYMLTAGHCGKVGQAYIHNGITFTDGVDRDVFDSTRNIWNSDSLTAHVLGGPNAVSPYNTFHASSIDKAHAINGTRSYSSQVVGEMSCFSGYATGTDVCGTIDARGITGSIDRQPTDNSVITVQNLSRMTRLTLGGDSGAPVYNGSTLATGIATAAATNGEMVYSAINFAAADMGVTVCVTSGC